MPFTTVPDKASGDVFTEQMWDQYIRDNLNVGVVRPIADTTLGGTASAITFSSIAASWAALLVLLYARVDHASTNRFVALRFNGDTGSNYDSQVIFGLGTGLGGGTAEQIGTAEGNIAVVPAASAPANTFGVTGILIPHYANTTQHKTALSLCGVKFSNATNSLQPRQHFVHWRSSSAITQVEVKVEATGGSSFVANTRATLLGLGGLV